MKIILHLLKLIFCFALFRWLFGLILRAQSDPVETLTVAIEGDLSGLMKDVEEGVSQASDKLEGMGDAGKKTGTSLVGMAGKAGLAFGGAAAIATKLVDSIIAIGQAAIQSFKQLTSEAINLASQFEQAELTFTNIFKSSDEAKKFMGNLQDEAVKLGISFNDAAQFGKSLLPDTKNIEQFNELLRIAAVASADTGRSVSDLIFTFNEAVSGDLVSMRDILDLPPDVRDRIKEAPGDVSVLIKELDKLFTHRGMNNLEAMSGTFDGLKRQIAGFREGLLGLAGAQILTPLRDGLQTIVDIIKEYGPSLNHVAEQFGEIFAMVIEFAREEIFNEIFNGETAFNFVEALKAAVEWLKSTVESFQEAASAAKDFGGQFLGLVDAFEPVRSLVLKIVGGLGRFIEKTTIAGGVFGKLAERIEEAGGFFGALNQAFTAGAQAIALVSASVKGLITGLQGGVTSFTGLAKAVFGFATGDTKLLDEALKQVNEGVKQVTEGSVEAFKESLLESAAALNKTSDEAENTTGKIKALGDQAKEIEQTPLIDPSKLEKFSDQLINAQEQTNAKRQQIEKDHNEKIADIINDGNEKALEIEDEYNKDLAKLSADGEKKRLEVIGRTREQLEELADNTNRQLSQRRKDHNQQERRQTEDHLRDMRRMQEDHLMNLEDAVRARDAGAIVDLQRQFATESQRKEEDFQVNRSRQDEDFDAELEGIRQNEAERREELLASQAQALADIQKHEDEKRLEIEARRIEENEKLQQNLQERLQRENESFAQRQAALDEALQKQLESIAKNLADENEVTEEGARQILETFNEYFGIGGNIDELMSDFTRRRKIRADITVAFQSAGVLPSESEPATPVTPQQALAAGLPSPGGQRIGGVQEFAQGGTLIASKPTLALFGEAGPEVVQFTPMSELAGGGGMDNEGRMTIEFTGSAPPGIGAGERDQVAAVLLTALRDSGALGG